MTAAGIGQPQTPSAKDDAALKAESPRSIFGAWPAIMREIEPMLAEMAEGRDEPDPDLNSRLMTCLQHAGALTTDEYGFVAELAHHHRLPGPEDIARVERIYARVVGS